MTRALTSTTIIPSQDQRGEGRPGNALWPRPLPRSFPLCPPRLCGEITFAPHPETQRMTSLLLTADRLFDGTGGPALVRPLLRVDGDRIEAVERALLPP